MCSTWEKRREGLDLLVSANDRYSGGGGGGGGGRCVGGSGSGSGRCVGGSDGVVAVGCSW